MSTIPISRNVALPHFGEGPRQVIPRSQSPSFCGRSTVSENVSRIWLVQRYLRRCSLRCVSDSSLQSPALSRATTLAARSSSYEMVSMTGSATLLLLGSNACTVADEKPTPSRQRISWLSVESVVSLSTLLERSLRRSDREFIYVLSVITSRYRGR